MLSVCPNHDRYAFTEKTDAEPTVFAIITSVV
jgi:hypothetical protein